MSCPDAFHQFNLSSDSLRVKRQSNTATDLHHSLYDAAKTY